MSFMSSDALASYVIYSKKALYKMKSCTHTDKIMYSLNALNSLSIKAFAKHINII